MRLGGWGCVPAHCEPTSPPHPPTLASLRGSTSGTTTRRGQAGGGPALVFCALTTAAERDGREPLTARLPIACCIVVAFGVRQVFGGVWCGALQGRAGYNRPRAVDEHKEEDKGNCVGCGQPIAFGS